VLKYAKTIQAKSLLQNKDFVIKNKKDSWELNTKINKIPTSFTNLPYSNILSYNLSLAITAFLLCNPLLTKKQIIEAIKTTKLEGRFDVLAKNPYIIADIAGNPQAGKNLAKNINEFVEKHSIKNIILIAGFLNDKDIKNTICPLLDISKDINFVSVKCDEFQGRDFSAKDMQKQIEKSIKIKVNIFDDLNECFKQIKTKIGKQDLLVAFGSFYLLADFYKMLENKNSDEK
jgi:dihydrofolate synthase/folylpolyglutamate synthase